METMEFYRALGARISELRRKRPLTQLQLGDLVGMSRATVASIEAGRQKVALDQVYVLGAALGVGQISDLIPMDVPRLAVAETPISLGAGVSSVQAAQIDSLVRSAVAQARGGRRRS